MSVEYVSILKVSLYLLMTYLINIDIETHRKNVGEWGVGTAAHSDGD